MRKPNVGSRALGLIFTAMILGVVASARAETREFLIVTNEIKWEGKGEKVVDRGRGPVSVIERYIFEPGFLVVNKGDTVVLKIHTVKGKEHNIYIPDFGIRDVRIKRGQEKPLTFVADKAGIFGILCITHASPESGGPMVGYLHVLGQ